MEKLLSRKFGFAGAAFVALMASGQHTLATVVVCAYLVANAAGKFAK